jgi:hypothetical protein
MSGGRFTKKTPDFVYFIGEDGGWIQGPYVNPQRGKKNRKFKLTEILIDETKNNKNGDNN